MNKRVLKIGLGILLMLTATSALFMNQKRYTFKVTDSSMSRFEDFSTSGHIHNTDVITFVATSALPFTVVSTQHGDRKYSSHLSTARYEYGVFILQPDHWEIKGESLIQSTVFTNVDPVHVAIDCPTEGEGRVACYNYFDKHEPWVRVGLVFITVFLLLLILFGITKEV